MVYAAALRDGGLPTINPLQRRIARLAAITLGLTLAPSLAAGQTVSFSDADFADADWTAWEIFDTSFQGVSSFVVVQAPVGGNPGAFRSIAHTIRSGALIVGHLPAGAVYDPAQYGAIESLDFSYDLIRLTALLNLGTGYGPLLRQNGSSYLLNEPTVITNLVWTHFDRLGLTPEMFVRFGGSGGPHPDFSADAAPIEVGYYSSNSSTGGRYTLESGIDNWSVTITSNAPPPPHECLPDWNNDGQVRSDDCFAYLDSYFDGDGDCDGDGNTDSDDFLMFLTAFYEGC